MKYGLARAALWVGSYLFLALLPAFVAWAGPAAVRTFWIEFGVGLGFAAFGVLALQFLLTGRYAQVASSFGLDSMLQYHRQVGIIALVLVLAHPAVLFAADADYLAYFDPRVDFFRAVALAAVTGAILLLVATSVWRTAFRLSYEWWRVWHGVLSIFVLFVGTVHILQVGHYAEPTWVQGFFVLAFAGSAGLLANTRIIRPARLRKRPYRLVETREERGDAWTLAFEPDGHRGFPFLPGQFVWLTLRQSPFTLQQHPYSLSSSSQDAPDRLEVTVKVEGDFSASVREVRPGRAAFLEGPFGYFVPDPDPRRGCVMVVGGVGITPCMSMLRTFADRNDPRDLHLLYANVSLDQVIFHDELEELRRAGRIHLTHVLEKPPEEWEGEAGLIDASLLERHLPPEREAYEYFICGPEPMMNVTESSLLELGIPQRRILSERFDMV